MYVDICIFLAIVALLVGGIAAIIRPGMGRRYNGFASLTAFHDLQSRNAQQGVETVIERQAEKWWAADESGQPHESRKAAGDTK